ncbi:hypothetical protein MUK42_17704, partial [Musa troglodytarum]
LEGAIAIVEATVRRNHHAPLGSSDEATATGISGHDKTPRLRLDHQLIHPAGGVPPQALERALQPLELRQPELLHVGVQQVGRGAPLSPQRGLQRLPPLPLRLEPLGQLRVLPVELVHRGSPRGDEHAAVGGRGRGVGRERERARRRRRRLRGAAGEEAVDNGVDGGVAEGEGLAGGGEDDEGELGAAEDGELVGLLE